MAVGIGQTITVVNKSGTIVKTSKHITNLFKEAKSAYLDKKAEFKISKDADLQRKVSAESVRSSSARPPQKKREQNSPHGSRHHSRRSSRDYDYESETRPRHHRRRDSERSGRSERSESDRREDRDFDWRNRHRPSAERGYSDSFYVNDHTPGRAGTMPLTSSNLRHSQTPSYASSPHSVERSELTRRRSDSDRYALSTIRAHSRSASNDSVRSALGYGELPPPLPARHIPEEDELRTKMTALQRMLQEANCVEHSAKAVMKHLESNPDAMAAIALTLAEVSNLATKMAPGALMALRSSFPVIMALLLSPEFLIAGGVALGVTVVSFGGYKIIKRMKRKKAQRVLEAGKVGGVVEETSEDELEEIEQLSQIDRIEQWRRGLSDVEVAALTENSAESSIEGMYVTPGAGKQLRAEGILPAKRDMALEKGGKTRKDKGKLEKVEEVSAKKAEKKGGGVKMITYRSKEDGGEGGVFGSASSAAAATIKSLFKKEKGEVIA